MDEPVTSSPDNSSILSLFDVFFTPAVADAVILLVLALLIGASVWSWTVIIEKSFSIGGARKKAAEFEEAFWSGRADPADGRPGTAGGGEAMSRVYQAASREWHDVRKPGALDLSERAALLDRASRSMKAAIERELASITNGLGVLATVGSASPFIGLFGTVYGIMFAIHGISAETNIAAVAPDIAEALFATALGLVAAIPAVIFYNKLTSSANRFADQLDIFSEDVLVRMSRKLSEGGK